MRDMGGLHLIEVSQCRSPLRRVARIPKVHEKCVRPVAQARLFKRATKYSLYDSSALSCEYMNVWICEPVFQWTKDGTSSRCHIYPCM